MELPRDILSPGLYVKPRLFLCNTDKERICKLDTTDTRGTFKFNSYSELSFVTARVYNDLITGETRVNPFFDKIEALRLIEVEDIGYFELQGPELTSNGIEEKKSCTAYSLEYTLAQKYLDKFYINMGTVDSKEVLNSDNGKIVPITLYNQNNPKLSLLHLVLEEIYGWRIGHVDASLKTLSRQFEIDRESVYDFLMNEVCERFNCYIVFDTLENTINLYAESRTAKFIGDGKTNTFIITPPFSKIGTVSVDGYKTTKWTYNTATGAIVLEDVPESGAHIEVIDGALTEWETDVFVSFDNLAQEVNISYSADDIKTKLNVTYGDGYDIREVNLGLPYLTDLSYYYTIDWMGQDLYDAYTKYMQTSNNSQLAYSQNSQEILKWSDRIAYEENRLSLEYSLAEHVNGTTVGTYYVKHETTDGYYYSEVSLPSEYNADIQYYSNVDTNVNEDKVKNLYNELKNYFYAYFNKDEDGLSKALDDLKTILGFEFLTTYTLVNLHDDLKVAATNNNQDDMDAAIYKFLNQLWPELGRTPLTDLYLKQYKAVQEQGIEAGWSNPKDPKNKNYGNYYPVILFINSIEIAIAERTATIIEYQAERKVYQDANANINNSLSMRENFTEAQLIRLSAFLREDELHIDDIVQTSIDDLSSSFKIKQDAMESGRIELQKLSQPQLQFSMTMANIYALSEFKPIIHQFQLGKVIKVCLRSDYIKQSRLLQVDINFDDFSDFSCSFGELTSLRTQSDIHADLLSQAITAGKSVATNSAAWTRGSDQATALDLKIQQGLLDATTQIKAIDGSQGVIIDKYGIKLQKKNGNEIDPKQAWLVNNMILFSDDGFKTSRSALGEITVDGEIRYGLLAEAVLAGYIEGSKIVGGTLFSDNYESGKSGTHFDLTNGDFEIGGGKIVYDADKNNLTLKDTTIEWDSTNTPSASEIDGLEEDIKSTIITKEYIETLSIKAGSVDAENISGTTITGKTLNGGSININDRFMVDDQGNVTIPSGTIKIGDVDGSSDLAKTSDIPTTISQLDNDVGYETAASIKNTVITKDYIETLQVKAGSVDAENISGTTITGKTINGGNLLIGNKENTYAEITTDGVLNCYGANITGTITATAGEIGGCIIDPEKGLQVSTANITGKLTADQIDVTGLTADSILVTNTNGLTLLSAGNNKVTMGSWNVAYNGLWKSDANGQIRLIPNGDLSTNYTVNEHTTKEWVILCGKDNTYNCNFGVTKKGSLYAKDVNLTGHIKATSGEIGGCIIDLTNGLQVPATHITDKLTADQINANNITATDVDISGTIRASNGDIGGWVIEKYGIVKYSDDDTIIAGLYGNFAHPDNYYSILSIGDSGKQNDWVVIAGKKFGIRETGDVYATNAHIYGYVDSKEGVIGNWEITEYGIEKHTDNGDALSAGFYNDWPYGNYLIGNATKNNWSLVINDKFGVTEEGVMYASDINISGGRIKIPITSTVDTSDLDLDGKYGLITAEGIGCSDVNDTKKTGSGMFLTNNGLTYKNSVKHMTQQILLVYRDANGNTTVQTYGTWASNAAMEVTSDYNAKHDIQQQSDKYSQIFDSLNPVTFKYNDGTSNRTHTGFIAQDVESAVLSAGLTTDDFAAVCYEIDEYGNKTNYGIRYDEIVSMNTYEIQKLKKRIAELEERLSTLH